MKFNLIGLNEEKFQLTSIHQAISSKPMSLEFSRYITRGTLLKSIENQRMKYFSHNTIYNCTTQDM